jgi:hypothetical protein
MKRMPLGRDDTCVDCGSAVAAGTEAFWDKPTRTVHCIECIPSAPDVGDRSDVDTPPEPEPPTNGQAGRSAQKEYERRVARKSAKDQQRIADDAERRRAAIERRPVLGRIGSALTPKPTIAPVPQTTTAWKKGAEGEERVAEVLADVPGIEVLHDRRVPKSKANLDHLVVGPRGVFIVDAKKYKSGKVEARDVGGLFRTDERLFVGGRDQTKVVDAMTWQIDTVRTALGDDLGSVAIHGVLCFIGLEWGFRPKAKRVRGVTVVWPLGLADVVRAPGDHTVDVERITAHLRKALPEAR